MKNIYLTLLMCVMAAINLPAQKIETTEVEFKVYGNCNMCKNRIENSLNIKGIEKVKWNKATKILTVVFDDLIEVDSLHKLVSLSGHDTELYKTDNETYKKLPKCCLYRGNGKTH